MIASQKRLSITSIVKINLLALGDSDTAQLEFEGQVKGKERGRESIKVARFLHELTRQRESIKTELLNLAEYDFPTRRFSLSAERFGVDLAKTEI